MAGRIYNKLNTFLKRVLDADTYERIRHRDACIVCSKKEDKAFKFILFSDESLFVTENPPFNITEVMRLTDIVSLRLIDKKPDFLSGEEQERVQHIEIVYEVDSPDDDKSRPDSSRSEKKKKNSRNKLNGSSTARSMLTSRSDTALLNMNRDQQRHVRFGSKNKLDTLSLNEFESQDKKKNKRDRKKKGKKQDSIEEEEGPEGLSLYLPDSQSNEDLTDLTNDAPLTSSRSTSSLKNFFTFKKKLYDEGSTGTPVYSGGDIIFIPHENDKDDLLGIARRTTEVYNVYILDGYSPFFQYLKTAMENASIDCTREFDPDIFERKNRESAGAGTPRAQTSENYELLYNQLRTELLCPTNSMRENFTLIRELKNAAQKIFFIKKLFWTKTTEVFDFCLNELLKYVPISCSEPLDLDLQERARRADELEYAILICELFQTMIRGTEIIQSRTKNLCGGGCSKIEELLLILTTLPEFPGTLDSSFFTLDVRQANCRRAKSARKGNKNAVFLNLTDEFIEVGLSLLFEIFIMAQETLEYPDFTIEWCGNKLESADDEGDLVVAPFLEVVIVRLLGTFAPNRVNATSLTALEHVALHHKLSVLCAIIKGSAILLNFIRERFFEEFKYYVTPYLVHKRLCPAFPLYPKVTDSLSQLVSAILEKDIAFHR